MASRGNFPYGEVEDTTPTGIAFAEEPSIANEKIKKDEQERQKKNLDRKAILAKLKQSLGTKTGKNGVQDTGDEDFIKQLQNKIMLVTKHPEIKDPSKKMKMDKIKFKYTSIKDVVEPEGPDSPKKEEVTYWAKIMSKGSINEYEKRRQFLPQEDINVIPEDPESPICNYEELKEKEPELVSKNKILQEKYNQDFRSNIISTGTVSLVADPKDKQVIDRTKLLMTEELPSDDSDDSYIDALSPILNLKQSSKDVPSYDKLQDADLTPLGNIKRTSTVEAMPYNLKRKTSGTPHSRGGLNTSYSLSSKATGGPLRAAPMKPPLSEAKEKFGRRPGFMSAKANPRRLQRKQSMFGDK